MKESNGKQIEAVILTKSAMQKGGIFGACVTAYDLSTKKLVRFVSNLDGSPIPYHISKQFDTLDYVSVKVVRPVPIGPQTENLLIDPNSFSTIPQRGDIKQIYDNIDLPSGPLFMKDNRYKLDSVDGYNHSLEILQVTNLVIQKETSFNKTSGKASFDCKYGSRKWFRVTDPKFDIRKMERETLEIGNAYIVASIPTEPYQDKGWFKFLAAIYPTEEH